MKVNYSTSIYELQAAFWRSEHKVVAVVDDNNVLIGLYGQAENNKLTTQETETERFKIDDVINKDCTTIRQTQKLDEVIEQFFQRNKFAYVPIVSDKDEFIEFRYNNSFDLAKKENNTLRRIIAERWYTYDKFEFLYEDCTFNCLICEKEIDTRVALQKRTTCLFGGGRLIRYVCPHCEAIVGPLKVLSLSSEDLAEDYKQHYAIFVEGDTTEDEIYTFKMLNPVKGKKYLNYGCGGNWSKSIKILRDEGYEVWGYEPFAATSKLEYILTEWDDIKSMRFDGIFSNNLLEHLLNPHDELKFMTSLLKDSESLMVHATPCFEYLYPYTRFHVCFPVGKSKEVLFDRAGLEIIEERESIIHGDKHICVVLKKAGKGHLL